MPILHSIVHRIDKTSDEQSAVLRLAEAEPANSEAMGSLLAAINDRYNTKPKAWGHFADTEAGSFVEWLTAYVENASDFVVFSHRLAEGFIALIDDQLSVGGYLLIAHYQQGDVQYLTMALLHQREGVGINEALEAVAAPQLNLGQLTLAARINLTQWRDDSPSQQYLSFIKDRGGKQLSERFGEWLGCREGIDATSETRTLLKAFSDYVESEELAEEQAREKTDALVDYANDQARRGEPITLDELSELIDEQQPKAFYNYIRHQDYGLSAEIPPDKRILHQFRRFAGRAGGVSISFDSHLLGSGVEYDEERDRLIIKKVPTQIRDQIKRRRE
ncbi:nucleoid-associated protein [Litchfieldella qijiaojingensis]|uniref:Nucleoid-associated protein n=1 Tax=Litchfieldella qijiaojingensis TaxID=980347 RepID=A0ABQ2YAM8_9GAMM|nr:nucleoid-associated protein YejK [Halomonas qijiaojingensis]GGX77176.1 nucleoid-associated protein [Halomonas qijiaojingensis]